MGSSRVRRGFHRLGILLAALPLLFGASLSLIFAFNDANHAKARYDKAVALACAQDALRKKFYPDMSQEEWTRAIKAKLESPKFTNDWLEQPLLKALECPGLASYVREAEVLGAVSPSTYSWWRNLLGTAISGLTISVALALAVYGVVRAVGWVVEGFAAQNRGHNG